MLLLQRLNRRVKIQLTVFGVISLVASTIMFVVYMQVPTTYLGVGRYTVIVQLPQSGGLYRGGNVTYRGVKVGRVHDVRLTSTGAEAVLRLKSNIDVPADVLATVHSVSAVGEQYVAFSAPPDGSAPPLKDGDVIPADRTDIPPDINSLLAATNRGLSAIPGDNLKTVVDEAYTAFGGLGPELSRLMKGMTTLASGARKDLDALTTLADQSRPVLESQIQSSESIQAWAAHLASATAQLRENDSSLDTILHRGGATFDEVRQLLDRLESPLPTILANLVSVGQVGVNYRDSLEQLLVVVTQVVAIVQGSMMGNANTKQDYAGAYLSFNLNLNLPPVCTTGYLPPQQLRSAVFEDRPPMPDGDVYCRIPQDAPNAVRGARNYPCETKPGKRAPTAQMCESDEEYVPLNDGNYWKGDSNATYTGQDIPQLRTGKGPRAQLPPPPVAAAEHERDLPAGGAREKTWQEMLIPPMGN